MSGRHSSRRKSASGVNKELHRVSKPVNASRSAAGKASMSVVHAESMIILRESIASVELFEHLKISLMTGRSYSPTSGSNSDLNKNPPL